MKKEDKKTWINAFYMYLAVLIVIFSLFSVFFSGVYDRCNDNVQNMLMNKSQQFLEKIPVLIAKTNNLLMRESTKTDEAGEHFYGGQASEKNQEYEDFEEIMEEYDKEIISKEKSCDKYLVFNWLFLILAISIAIWQFITSRKYLKKYE